MNKLGPSSIERISYAREAEGRHLTPILLVGSSQELYDVELVLEDKWRDLRRAETSDSLRAVVQGWTPRVALVGPVHSAESPQELQMLDVMLKDVAVRTLLTSDRLSRTDKNALARRTAASGIRILETTGNYELLASDIDSFLNDLLDRQQLTFQREFSALLAARDGFLAGVASNGGTWDSAKADALSAIARTLLSQFRLDSETAEICDCLIQVSDFRRALEPLGESFKELTSRFQALQDRVKAKSIPFTELIDLATKARDVVRFTGALSEETWKILVSESKIPPVSRHVFSALHSKLIISLASQQAETAAVQHKAS